MHPKELLSEQSSVYQWVHHLEHQSERWKDLSLVLHSGFELVLSSAHQSELCLENHLVRPSEHWTDSPLVCSKAHRSVNQLGFPLATKWANEFHPVLKEEE